MWRDRSHRDPILICPSLTDTVGAKFNIVTGYPGYDIDLGAERGEIHCRAFTIEALAVSPITRGARRASYAPFSDRSEAGPKTPGHSHHLELMDQHRTTRRAGASPPCWLRPILWGDRCLASRCSGGSVKDSARGLYEDDERSPVARGSEEEEL